MQKKPVVYDLLHGTSHLPIPEVYLGQSGPAANAPRKRREILHLPSPRPVQVISIPFLAVFPCPLFYYGKNARDLDQAIGSSVTQKMIGSALQHLAGRSIRWDQTPPPSFPWLSLAQAHVDNDG
jgi:hypothetical protein